MKQELWKPIKNYEGYYEISNFGRVKSLQRVWKDINGVVLRRKKESIMKPGYVKTPRGKYLHVTLSLNGIKTYPRINRLVAEHFCEKREGCNVVNHKDSNSINNHSDNLEWVTVLENVKHSWEFGNQYKQFGELNVHSRLKNEDVLKIRELAKIDGVTHQSIADIYGVRRENITKIINRQRWQHI